MGMPCEVNSILKLNSESGFPEVLEYDKTYTGVKEDYRILLVDVPIMLVDSNWYGHADVIITSLMWKNNQTIVTFKVDRIYNDKFLTKI
jgi:hypothetical protein